MRSARIFIGAAFAASLCLAAPALAQVAAAPAPSSTVVDVGGLFGAWRPLLLDIVATAVTAGLSWIAYKVQQAIGLNIEEKNRAALHTSIMSGVGAALDFLQVKADAMDLDVRNKVIAYALNHAAASVPGALKALGVAPDAAVGNTVLMNIASAKLDDKITTAKLATAQSTAADAERKLTRCRLRHLNSGDPT